MYRTGHWQWQVNINVDLTPVILTPVIQTVHTDEPVATFSFASLMVGAASHDFTSGRGAPTENALRRPWKSSESNATNFDADIPPDFLRPGETVRLIAINRATGYMGTKSVRLAENYSQGDGLLQHEIQLYPPNLKVIATRTFKDQAGLTKDERHENQLIGSEGAGLTT